MGRVTQTHRAKIDLDDIWLQIALDSPAAADLLIDRIVDRCNALGDHPRLGPARPEIAPDARMLVIGGYLALYRLRGDGALIVRVVHGAQEIEGLFETDLEP
ncbi:MAG: type II toxin-antitoxin system RelE/ParE family toxin [Gemmatimonadaceae bacterium]|uniref:type II toxin-antitoxin system RelE/ParE family toxin n=1 Tax=Caulobacter sp. DWP3-1-3b2 TaxID=2804643 RepID=UPI0019C19A2E|nr:type II toxin-antitoxin system RelE/ParE family toxin [Caulobacter sp.]